MRNYFAIAFTCVYLTLTVGVAKTTHYCMGREKHTSLFSFTTEKCACYLFLKEASSCCADEHQIVKIDDDQSGGKVINSPAPEFSMICELFALQPDVIQKTTDFQVPEANLPPPKIPLYQVNCSLVFYDSMV